MAKLNDEGMAVGGGRNMKPGDSFTFIARNSKGETGRTITIMRTERPYLIDYCEALNDAREPGNPFENYVDKHGNIRLRLMSERINGFDDWKPEPGEVDAMQAKIARYRSQGMTQEEFNERVDRGLEG